MRATALFPFLSLLGLVAFTACGMFHEKEPVPATVSQSTGNNADCKLAPMQSIRSERGVLLVPEAKAWVACLKFTINKSFSQVKGSEKDAVSAVELGRLAKANLINLPLKTNAEFDGLGGFMSLLNPEGHPAVSLSQALNFADLLNASIDLISQIQKNPDGWDRDLVGDFLTKSLQLFPGKGEFTQTHLRELLELSDDETLKVKVTALFPLLRLAFRNSLNQDEETRLSGSSLRELAVMGVAFYEQLKHIPKPSESTTAVTLARDHEKEIHALVELILNYFKQDGFTALKAREVRTLFIDGLGTSPVLAEDTLLLARRFLAEPDADQAISSRLLLPFLKDHDSLLKDYQLVGKYYHARDDFKTRGELLATGEPALQSIALKAKFINRYWSSGPLPQVKRRDVTIGLDQAIEMLNLRYVFKKLFVAFGSPGHIDPVKGIYIPKKALSEDEEHDAKNLARMFLRFATSLSHTENEKEEQTSTDIRIDDGLAVKSQSVYQIMGLVGDRWFYDGNQDGYLNAEEFFSVITLFMEATRFTSSNSKYYKTDHQDNWKHPLFIRKDFIESLLTNKYTDMLASSPYAPLEGAIQHMQHPESLFHSLMSRSDAPIEAYFHAPNSSNYDTYQKVTLTDWVEPASLVPANAILGLIDRAFLKCDLDEDQKLDWKELDCAAVLMSGGLYHVADSGAIDLDAGLHDGLILLAKAVYDPETSETASAFEKRLRELPKQVFKLFLAQGGAQLVLDQSSLDALAFTAEELIPTVVLGEKPALRAIYLAEVVKVFGECDLNHDGIYLGKELQCVYAKAAQKWLDFLNTPDMRAQIQKLIPFASPEQIETILKSDEFKGWFVYLIKGIPPIKTVATETSILDAFESAVRRSCPLGFEVREDKCLQP